jgi:hypothetical protein
LRINDATTSYSIITTNNIFYWNEKIDFALMDILKNNWNSPLEYVVSLFNTSCNTNIIIKKINCIQYLQIYLKNNTNGCVNEILSNPFISIPLSNFLKDPKIQMEHSHLIVEPNVTQNKIKLIGHFMATICLNY